MAAATTSSLGEIKLAGDLAGGTDANAPQLTATGITAGTYVLPTVTFDAKGRATAASAGSSATIISMLPDATSSVKGIASFPAAGGLVITTGQVSIPDATSSVKGVASFSTDFTVTAGSVALNPASLPVASSSQSGTVKTGANITNTAGLISVADATSSVKGVASFGADFTVTSGSVALNLSNLPVATGSVLGLVKTGANITNTAGTISIPVGSSSVAGVLQTGTNITNTAGTISVPDATTSVKGVASFSTDFTVTSGSVALSTTVGRTDVQNTWSKAQSYAIVPLTYAATITPDFSLSNVFSLTATGNFTLANPTNVVAGTTYLIFITQDATGGRVITWGSNFKFGAGATNTLSTVASKRDIISIVAVSSTVLLVSMQQGY